MGGRTAVFGLSTIFVLSYILFALTGAGDTVSTVIRGTLRQMLTPDHLRGRMTSVNMVFFMGGPQLGELEAGIAAQLFGPVIAVAFLLAVIIFGALVVLRGLEPGLAALDLGSALAVLALMLAATVVAFARQQDPALPDRLVFRTALARLTLWTLVAVGLPTLIFIGYSIYGLPIVLTRVDDGGFLCLIASQ